MSRIIQLWNGLTSLGKSITVGVAVFLLVAVYMLGQNLISGFHDKRFTEAEQQHTQEREQLQHESTEHKARADLYQEQAEQWEAKAKAQAVINDAIINAAGQKAVVAQEKINNAITSLQQQNAGIDSTTDAIKLCNDACTASKRLSYIKQDADCNCQ